MAKYCCFSCPATDRSEKTLDDVCPTCGRQYGFPVSDFPSTVGTHRVTAALGRGFYAATYVAERGALNAKSVLKVSPVKFYEFFADKDFEEECRTHAEVAAGTEHIVGIRDMFEATVTFGATEMRCHVAELDYVKGRPLADYLSGEVDLDATVAAQIAIDLFTVLHELRDKRVNHNDLHAANIVVEALGANARRAQAVNDSIRAVAIDLGSIADASKSDSEKCRLGDLHWVARHLDSIINGLLQDPDRVSDLDNRLAHALQVIMQSISASAEHQRTPALMDVVEQIESAFYRVRQHWRPWRETLSLKTFGASYNAQTMQAWHVPQLLVDPDGQWLNSIRPLAKIN